MKKLLTALVFITATISGQAQFNENSIAVKSYSVIKRVELPNEYQSVNALSFRSVRYVNYANAAQSYSNLVFSIKSKSSSSSYSELTIKQSEIAAFKTAIGQIEKIIKSDVKKTYILTLPEGDITIDTFDGSLEMSFNIGSGFSFIKGVDNVTESIKLIKSVIESIQ